MDATDRLPPSEDTSDVTMGEMFGEILYFAVIIGLIAGGGYGLFAGYTEWHHASLTPEKKNAMLIVYWGLGWAVGGAVAITLLCGFIVALFLGTTGLIRRLVRR